jgi:hypothetical protein
MRSCPGDGSKHCHLHHGNWTIFHVRLCGINVLKARRVGTSLDQVYDPEAMTYLQGLLQGQVGRSTYACSMGTT